jgi:membrane associated rhomboid family serine protease
MSTLNKYESSDPSSRYTSMEYEQKESVFDKNGYPLKYHYYDPKSKDGAGGEDEEEEEEEEIYIVRQNWGYCSIFFSIIQTIILALMMWQCGVAPMSINPMIGPYPDGLSEWGGKNSVLILEDDEWWRLVTPILLHAGVIHLVCNVAVQLETGVFFEKEWGSVRWTIVYMFSAVGSSVLSVIVMPNAVSVGSSGAVMGLFGGKLAEVLLRFTEPNDTEQEQIGHKVRKEQCFGVTCSVVVVMLFSFIPYVDWAAHLGGVLAGFVVGIFVFATEIRSHAWRFFWMVVGVLLSIASFTMALQYMYSGNIETIEELRDVCGYYTENFENYECNCMREDYAANGGDDE